MPLLTSTTRSLCPVGLAVVGDCDNLGLAWLRARAEVGGIHSCSEAVRVVSA